MINHKYSFVTIINKILLLIYDICIDKFIDQAVKLN